MADEKRPPETTEQPRSEPDGRPLDGYRRGDGQPEQQPDQEKRNGEQTWTRHDVGHPARTFVFIAAGVLALVFGALLLLGYFPRHRREEQAAQAALIERESIPAVTVVEAKRAPRISQLLLPGNITAITEASIFARAAGYVRRRY